MRSHRWTSDLDILYILLSFVSIVLDLCTLSAPVNYTTCVTFETWMRSSGR